MAQTKRKTKHRGNAAGVVESRGRTGRKPTADEKAGKPTGPVKQKYADKRDKPPSWLQAFYKAAIAAVLVLLVSMFLFKKANQAIKLFPIVLLIYVPLSYYIDRMMYQRYQRIKAKERQARRNAQ
jgi:hypothetical protein